MERTMTKMPKSVITAVIATGIYIAVMAATQISMAMQGQKPTAAIALAVFFILLLLFAKGQRLGRPILIFFIVLSLLGVSAAILVPIIKTGTLHFRSLFILLVISSPLITALIALFQKSAKIYSGYVCPSCGSGNIKAMDFMYNSAKCKDCGNMWN